MVPPDATLKDFDVNDMLTLSAKVTGVNRSIIIITASTSLMISHTTCPEGVDGDCVFLSDYMEHRRFYGGNHSPFSGVV